MEHDPVPDHGFTAVGAAALAHVALALGITILLRYLFLPDWTVGVSFVLASLLLLPAFLPLYRRLFPDGPNAEA